MLYALKRVSSSLDSVGALINALGILTKENKKEAEQSIEALRKQLQTVAQRRSTANSAAATASLPIPFKTRPTLCHAHIRGLQSR